MCDNCKNAKTCKYLQKGTICPPFSELANGNKPLIEEYLDTSMHDVLSIGNYNDVIHSIMRAKEQIHKINISKIKNLPHNNLKEARMKLLAAGVYSQMPVKIICLLLRIDTSTLYKELKRK